PTGQELTAVFRQGYWFRDIPPGPPQHSWLSRHNPEDGIVHPGDDGPVMEQKKIGNGDQFPEGVMVIGADGLATPVAAGHDKFDYTLAKKALGDILPKDIRKLAGSKALNMTTLALNLSRFVNGVAQKHGEVSRNMFPGYHIDAITNGVHPNTWVNEIWKPTYNHYLPGWQLDPDKFKGAYSIPDEEFFERHMIAKRALIRFVNHSTQAGLDYDILTIGFGRRATGYKRADLIFKDLERFVRICTGKVQFIFAGKSHPKDYQGKDLIKNIVDISHQLRGKVKVSFIENYDIYVALLMTSGVDVWLNTPQRPREASGTSGMKAALNGIPNFSVLDGWWIEGYEEDVTGWAIGPKPTETNLVDYDDILDADDFYIKLKKKIIPLYYNTPSQWIQIMKNSIAKIGPYFNTHRMLKEYLQKAYSSIKVKAL
ncbi:MAG: alpha-glucan family phosphorylase, partial [Candidatus Margulisbacteria bacterium]|nr:alpha-glucan family phosphorylase [Candidatus Margulisiibacteriota bacterium]